MGKGSSPRRKLLTARAAPCRQPTRGRHGGFYTGPGTAGAGAGAGAEQISADVIERPAARKGKGSCNMVNFLEEDVKPFKPRDGPLFIMEPASPWRDSHQHDHVGNRNFLFAIFARASSSFPVSGQSLPNRGCRTTHPGNRVLLPVLLAGSAGSVDSLDCAGGACFPGPGASGVPVAKS